MNEKHKIDDLFKKALSDYKEELPSANTELQIFRKLSYNKYLKFFKTFGIYAIAIPVAILAYIIININSNNNITETKQITDTKNEIIEKTISNNYTEQQKNKTIKINNFVIDKNTQLTDVKESKTNNNKISNEKEDNLALNNKATIDNINKNNVSFNKILKNDNQISKRNILIENKNENIDPTELKDIQLSNNQIDSETESKSINIIENQQEIIQTEKQTEPIKVENNIATKNEENKTSQNDIVSEIKTKDNNTSVKKIDNGLAKEIKFEKINPFALDISGNLFFVNKKLSSNNESDIYIKTRNEGETNITTFLPSIELKINTKHFYLQTGIGYQMLGEKVNYNLTDIETDIKTEISVRDSLVFLIDPNNSSGHWIYDTLTTFTNDTTSLSSNRSLKYNNTYKYFEIPLLIGKSFAFNRFIIDLSTGVSLGFLIKADAQILSSDNSTILKIDNSNSPLINDLTMNYLLRVGFRYSINRKWSVFARPSLKVNLGSVLNENQYAVKQKYTLYGVGIGLMYKL